MTSLPEIIDKLAQQIAEDAIKDDKPVEVKQDAFKLLFPYYALLFKARAKEGDGASDDLTFGAMAAAFTEEQHGGSVPDRAGTRGNGIFDEPES